MPTNIKAKPTFAREREETDEFRWVVAETIKRKSVCEGLWRKIAIPKCTLPGNKGDNLKWPIPVKSDDDLKYAILCKIVGLSKLANDTTETSIFMQEKLLGNDVKLRFNEPGTSNRMLKQLKPITGGKKPVLACVRDRDARPKLTNLRTDTSGPGHAWLLNEIPDLKYAESEMERDEPGQFDPGSGTIALKSMHLLNGNDKPVCERLKVVAEDPNHAHDRKGMKVSEHMPYKTSRDGSEHA